jgi:large exoprotein involved in heme utilization and adhesion
LQVPGGKAITLVGGDILNDGGSIKSAGGQVNIVSLRSPAEISADPGMMTGGYFKVTYPQAGQIQLLNGAQLDTSGAGGGRIVIRGGSLTVDNSKIQANTTGASAGQGIHVAINDDLNLLNGGQITSRSTTGYGLGGDVNVDAGSIRIDGGGAIDNNGFPSTGISTATGEVFVGGGPAKGGDITINTHSLELVNSAQISSESFGAGDAGSIRIHASSIRMDALLETVVWFSADTQQGGGNAGDIIIRVGNLAMFNGATMFATSSGSGRAGLIVIDADSVQFNSGSIITAGTFGSGNGGDVQLTANSLRIDGRDTLTGGPDFLTGIQAVTTSLDAPAPGGNLQITAGTIEMDNMGSLFTTSFGQGPGGNVDVTAGKLTLNHESSIQAQGLDVGPAGNITLNISGTLQLAGNSAISTAAPGSSGGNINVVGGSEIQLSASAITANAGLDGGNISVSAPKLIYLLKSSFNAQADSTGSGFGNGGNLQIDPSFLILNNSSLISKSSFGNGGNISILTDFFFQSGSLIDASAPFGLPGTVSVTAPEVDLSGSLIGLPENLLDASARLRPDCGMRLTKNVSSFVVVGRGGLPLIPDGFIPSTPILSLEAK